MRNVNSRKVLLVTLLLLFLSAPIVYGLLLFIDEILLSNNNYMIVEGSKDAWIGFAGSIIGGLITMLALYFTIKEESDKAEEDKVKTIRPFIICKPEFNEDFMKSFSEDRNGCQYLISLVVENISNNLVKDLKLESETVYEYNPETNKYDLENQKLVEQNKTHYCIYTVLLDSMEMIKPNSSFSYQTNFLIDDYKTAYEKSPTSFKVVAIYKYRDILDVVEYTHRLEYELFISFTNNGEFILDTQSIKNKIIKEEKMLNK